MRAHHCRGNQRFCLKLRWGELSQSNSLSRNHCVRGGWHSLKNSSTWRRKTPIQRTFSLPFPSPIHPGFEAGDNLWNFTMLTKRQPSYWDCTLKASGIWTWICSLAKRIIAAPRLSSSFHFFFLYACLNFLMHISTNIWIWEIIHKTALCLHFMSCSRLERISSLVDWVFWGRKT